MVHMHCAVMQAAEASMHRMYRQHVRRMWIVRAVVLLNVGVFAWDLADSATWVQWVSVLPALGAWHAFRVGERFARDLPWMRQTLADVRDKIKTVEGMTNES